VLSSGCVPNLVITADVPAAGIDHQEAMNTITASNTVFGTAEAVYHAGDEVLLVSDFDALNGSEFRAYIEACTGVFVKSTEDKVDYVKVEKPRIIEYFKEGKSDISIEIAPNPTAGIFNIELKDHTLNDFNVQIYSMSRGLMYNNQFEKENLRSFQIDISKFPSGVYIVKLVNLESKETFTGRVIKKD